MEFINKTKEKIQFRVEKKVGNTNFSEFTWVPIQPSGKIKTDNVEYAKKLGLVPVTTEGKAGEKKIETKQKKIKSRQKKK